MALRLPRRSIVTGQPFASVRCSVFSVGAAQTAISLDLVDPSRDLQTPSWRQLAFHLATTVAGELERGFGNEYSSVIYTMWGPH